MEELHSFPSFGVFAEHSDVIARSAATKQRQEVAASGVAILAMTLVYLAFAC